MCKVDFQFDTLKELLFFSDICAPSSNQVEREVGWKSIFGESSWPSRSVHAFGKSHLKEGQLSTNAHCFSWIYVSNSRMNRFQSLCLSKTFCD